MDLTRIHITHYGEHWHQSQRGKPYGIQGNEPTFVIRNTKRTNWESYKDDLITNLETMSRKIRMIRDTDTAVDQLRQAIISSKYSNRPVRTTHKVP
jgi:hypothetical protein